MEERDKEVVSLINTLPENVIKRRGNKAKSKELKRQCGVTVNHKRMARICRFNACELRRSRTRYWSVRERSIQKHGLLAQNRRRKHPAIYYVQQKEERKDLPKNILNRDFAATAPLQKLCTDVSYFKTKEGWLYLSPRGLGASPQHNRRIYTGGVLSLILCRRITT